MPDIVSESGLRKVIYTLGTTAVLFLTPDDVAVEVGAGCGVIRLPLCSQAAGRIYSISLAVGAVPCPTIRPEATDSAEICSGAYKGDSGGMASGGHVVLYSSGEEWYSISEEAMTWV